MGLTNKRHLKVVVVLENSKGGMCGFATLGIAINSFNGLIYHLEKAPDNAKDPRWKRICRQ